MKKLILWLAKKFNVSVEKTVTEKIVEYKYLTAGVVHGDVFIDGNLTIDGELTVKGNITFYKNR